MLDIQSFLEQYKNVVNWNLVARNGVHVFDEDAVKRQGDYVREEIKETIKGLEEANSVEVLDGVADIFVTMTYKHFIASQGVVFDEEIAKCIEFMSSEGTLTFENDHELAQSHLLEISQIVNNENECEVFDTTSLCSMIELMNLTELYYDVNIMEVVKHVMDSNWSKYPPLNKVDIQKEVEYISKKNPDRKDIVGVTNDEYHVVVFRSDNGTGKIMKPSSFWNADCSRFL